MNQDPANQNVSDEVRNPTNLLKKMPEDMPSWMSSTILKIDRFSKIVGNIVCWILIPLIFAMTYEVIMRKFFLAPTIWAYDISRFLYEPCLCLEPHMLYQKACIYVLIFYIEILKQKHKGL